MPEYVYRARNQEGGEVRGAISCTDADEARKILRNRGLFVLELSLHGSAGLFQRIARLFHRESESRSRP